LKQLIKEKEINEGERSKEKDDMKRKGEVKSETGETGEREGNNDALFDVSNKILGSLSANAYVVKMIKGW
jgi:hypothetical protein